MIDSQYESLMDKMNEILDAVKYNEYLSEIDLKIARLTGEAERQLGVTMNVNMSLIYDLQMNKKCIKGELWYRKRTDRLWCVWIWDKFEEKDKYKYNPIIDKGYIIAWEEKA